jgi:hypothetical protein
VVFRVDSPWHTTTAKPVVRTMKSHQNANGKHETKTKDDMFLHMLTSGEAWRRRVMMFGGEGDAVRGVDERGSTAVASSGCTWSRWGQRREDLGPIWARSTAAPLAQSHHTAGGHAFVACSLFGSDTSSCPLLSACGVGDTGMTFWIKVVVLGFLLWEDEDLPVSCPSWSGRNVEFWKAHRQTP